MSPVKPLSPCSFRGCPNPAVSGGRCTMHERQRKALIDANRGTAAQRGYDAEWRKKRAAILKQHPDCSRCAQPATDVHHIPDYVPGTNHDDYTLVSLCHSCHSAATMKRSVRR